MAEEASSVSPPPYFEGHNIGKYNTATLLSLSPIVELPLTPLKDSTTGLEYERRVLGFSSTNSQGVLLPLERMPLIAPSFRRMKIGMDYSRVVSLPVDKYERPIIVLNKDNEKQKETCKTMPFIFLPSDNPSLLHDQIRVIMSSAFDYEPWYYLMKGVATVIDRQTGEEYDPLPLARFLPLPNDILSILYQLGSKIKAAHRSMRAYEFTPEEEALRKKAAYYFQAQLFDNNSKDGSNSNVGVKDDDNQKKSKTTQYFFKLSHMSPKDIMIHLCQPVESGYEITQRIISSGRAVGGIKGSMNKKTEEADERTQEPAGEGEGEEESGFTIKHPDPGHQLQLVLLPWDTAIGMSVEFRCFVHNRRLCAVSQYDFSASTLLQVPDRSALFKRLIEDFYQQLKPSIPFSSCVMDVVVKRSNAPNPTFESTKFDPKKAFLDDDDDKKEWRGEDKERWRVHLLEFNPFYADGTSGTSLFDWKREFSIIYNGYKAADKEDAEWKTVLRYRIADPQKSYRGPLDKPRNPLVLDII
eukprot:TRINITY_DN761_c0_g1_i1.p1 TRINITY_DN761_c0_g1~~TRINITY_DN761_c0_g1_i1.p1  ORF type:complete len:561 (+),score=153.64 TRINITY_DN761_c0_g1_i1:106-1683(+)